MGLARRGSQHSSGDLYIPTLLMGSFSGWPLPGATSSTEPGCRLGWLVGAPSLLGQALVLSTSECPLGCKEDKDAETHHCPFCH